MRFSWRASLVDSRAHGWDRWAGPAQTFLVELQFRWLSRPPQRGSPSPLLLVSVCSAVRAGFSAGALACDGVVVTGLAWRLYVRWGRALASMLRSRVSDQLDATSAVCRTCAPSAASFAPSVSGRMVEICGLSALGLLGRSRGRLLATSAGAVARWACRALRQRHRGRLLAAPKGLMCDSSAGYLSTPLLPGAFPVSGGFAIQSPCLGCAGCRRLAAPGRTPEGAPLWAGDRAHVGR